MSFEHLKVERDGHTGIVSVNRPKALNALNGKVLAELDQAFAELEKDDEVYVLILTGEGKAFVAGADIAEMQDFDAEEARDFSAFGQKVFGSIELLEKPVIAAVNGFCLGGGLELAMGCDFRVAAKEAKFGHPEVNLGLIPGFAGTSRLQRLVGHGKARQLLLTGGMISADEAHRIGLVDEVVPGEELMPTVKKMAEGIATKGPLALKLVKRLLTLNHSLPVASAADMEALAFGVCFGSGQAREGMIAFLEKRQADWDQFRRTGEK